MNKQQVLSRFTDDIGKIVNTDLLTSENELLPTKVSNTVVTRKSSTKVDVDQKLVIDEILYPFPPNTRVIVKYL